MTMSLESVEEKKTSDKGRFANCFFLRFDECKEDALVVRAKKRRKTTRVTKAWMEGGSIKMDQE
jgi:hypothetical protein